MNKGKYVTKQGVERVKVAGLLSEFEELGVVPDEVYDQKGTGIIRDPDDETLAVLEEFIAKRKYDSARAWAVDDREDNTRRRWMLDWASQAKKINEKTMTRQGMLTRDDAEQGVKLMKQDGWIDGNGKLTGHGGREIDECILWLEMKAKEDE